MARGVSLREFARRMGVTVSTVQRARDTKRITLNPDGTVDPEKGRRDWGRNTLHTKRPPRKQKVKPSRNGGDEEPEDALGSMSSAFHKARAVRESIQARILDLDLKLREGKLLDADEVRRAQFTISRRIRDLLMAMPGRLAAEVAGADQAEARRMLQQEVDRICDELPSENGHEPRD